MEAKKLFLFSIDLEDIRLLMPDGIKYQERVCAMTEKYLTFLRRHNARCTFFVVGDQIRNHPDLIRRICDYGHEIACHTNTHIPLTKLSPQSFRDDTEQFLSSAHEIGISDIKGFRAPVFSITEKTGWAYRILKEFGFEYSSSVLPAKNPLHGWKEFGTGFRMVDGIFEMPISLHPKLQIPLAGGVYFRLLPFFLIKNGISKLATKGLPVQNYLHPYDIDTEQEHFMHPGINDSKLYNYLMYYNRSSVFEKLEKILDLGFEILAYRDYVSSLSLSIN